MRIDRSLRFYPVVRQVSVRQEREAGFSLIELMVVIGIMAIVMAIAGGAYSSWRESTRVDSAKEKIVSILQQARLAALSRRTAQTVTFNYAGAGANPNTVTDVLGQLHRFQGVTLLDFVCGGCNLGANNTENIIFTPRGTATQLTVQVSSPTANKVFFIQANSTTSRVAIRRTCVAPNCI
ncbi:MAG: prepilin-type N-terminal cleavage/methylation domain-containing protein [Mariprofundaceae bacterium]|nr:prepilin-type N-terminal cleavage/methylation domain-containing protein [Mariprofundaceae bacterium]